MREKMKSGNFFSLILLVEVEVAILKYENSLCLLKYTMRSRKKVDMRVLTCLAGFGGERDRTTPA